MKILKDTLSPIDFEGLEIIDYTAGKQTRSSMAEITVAPGVSHRRAWSKRSDKYYYVVSGRVQFTIEDEVSDLAAGDTCIILQGQRFAYHNMSDQPAKLVLVHTPSFDLEAEVLDEEEAS